MSRPAGRKRPAAAGARGTAGARGGVFLRSARLDAPPGPEEGFPFSLPLVRGLGEVDLSAPVTVFIGENGCGKSTLLEGLAAACDLPVVGSAGVRHDETLRHGRALGRRLRLAWNVRTRRGFFLRAEDFFGFTKRLREQGRELEEMAGEFGKRGTGAGWSMARGAALHQRGEMRRRYGEDLDANSHGESFLKLFQSRLVPGGLYILDEPEAPLSPQRQLALLAVFIGMVAKGCQFIVATHSPILMAMPGARLLGCDSVPPRETAFEDAEHVRLTRSFLGDPGRFLKHLL